MSISSLAPPTPPRDTLTSGNRGLDNFLSTEPLKLRRRSEPSRSARGLDRRLDTFLQQVQHAFGAQLAARQLYGLSEKLQIECLQRLKTSKACMLPSPIFTLPTGRERGVMLAMDVGGSTFRLALVRLGRPPRRQSTAGGPDTDVIGLRQFTIDGRVRNLPGNQFFAWMAEKIEGVLSEYLASPGIALETHRETFTKPVLASIAWSFPMSQTSRHSAFLLPMGKSFGASQDLNGARLESLISEACARRGLEIRFEAIVNDSVATLLSGAYLAPNTRLSLIMGTGINSAIYIPQSILGQDKSTVDINGRAHVCVNTEISMLGKGIWPSTCWDDAINASQPIPDYQPLEYKAAGRSIGEIVRRIIFDGVRSADLFQGNMPSNLDKLYALETKLVAAFEQDDSPGLLVASSLFLSTHPLPNGYVPRPQDFAFIKSVAILISTRSAAFVAVALHALWRIQNAHRGTSDIHADGNKEEAQRALEKTDDGKQMTIAYSGSTMELYPNYQLRCQGYLDALLLENIHDGSCSRSSELILQLVSNRSLAGAALAALLEQE